jgi:hypothetical protein
MIFNFLFRIRVSRDCGQRVSDVEMTCGQVTPVLLHRKGLQTLEPLVLTFAWNPAFWFPYSSLALRPWWSRDRRLLRTNMEANPQ